MKAIMRNDGVIFRYNNELLRYPEFTVVEVDKKMRPVHQIDDTKVIIGKKKPAQSITEAKKQQARPK